MKSLINIMVSGKDPISLLAEKAKHNLYVPCWPWCSTVFRLYPYTNGKLITPLWAQKWGKKYRRQVEKQMIQKMTLADLTVNAVKPALECTLRRPQDWSQRPELPTSAQAMSVLGCPLSGWMPPLVKSQKICSRRPRRCKDYGVGYS